MKSINFAAEPAPGTRFVWGDWHTGCHTTLPGSAVGSQPVEAYHGAWQRKRRYGKPARSVNAAFSVYRRVSQRILAELNAGVQNLEAIKVDERLLRLDALKTTCEATAVDYQRYKKRTCNHLVVESTTGVSSASVVFRVRHAYDSEARQIVEKSKRSSRTSKAKRAGQVRT